MVRDNRVLDRGPGSSGRASQEQCAAYCSVGNGELGEVASRRCGGGALSYVKDHQQLRLACDLSAFVRRTKGGCATNWWRPGGACRVTASDGSFSRRRRTPFLRRCFPTLTGALCFGIQRSEALCDLHYPPACNRFDGNGSMTQRWAPEA
jgi:hypothetical protein